MIKKPALIDFKYVVAALAVLVIGLGACLLTNNIQRNEYEEMQLNAARNMKEAEIFLKQKILEKGIGIEPEDLNATGLLGPEFTELTTTPGSEDAKRTALNPNFAAAMIRYYHEAGLEEGDEIAIGTSGSFPGFIIATVVAAKEMGLKTKVIASVGASMHGATRPAFNVFDILLELQENGYADFDLLAVSGGGANDQGGGVLEGIFYEGSADLAQDLCRAAAERSGAEVINFDRLSDSINRRLELFGPDIRLFINVGGAAPNEGTSSYTLNFPQGLVLSFPTIPQVENRGLCYEYAERGVPVLNLLNVKLLASENGIAYDAVPMQEPGASMVYTTNNYSIPLILVTVFLCLAVLVFGVILKRREKKKQKSGVPEAGPETEEL